MSRAPRARSARTPPTAADWQSAAVGGYSLSGLYHLDILGDFDDFGDFGDFGGGFGDFGGDFGDVDGSISTCPRV